MSRQQKPFGSQKFLRNVFILTSGRTIYTIERLSGHVIENLNIYDLQIIANHNADKHKSRRNG